MSCRMGLSVMDAWHYSKAFQNKIDNVTQLETLSRFQGSLKRGRCCCCVLQRLGSRNMCGTFGSVAFMSDVLVWVFSALLNHTQISKAGVPQGLRVHGQGIAFL